MDNFRPLKYTLWNIDGIDSDKVTIDPFAVSSVVETTRRRAYGGNNNVAIIRMRDGKEYVVEDDRRQVQLEIWTGKSYTT
jgi:hypothetical protein